MKSKTSFLLEGIVKRHPDGFGFLIPDDHKHPDVYIPSGKMGSALTNDRVQVLVHRKKKEGPRSYFGFIHSILKRDKEFAVGPFEMKEDKAIIRKHNLSFNTEILVSNPKNISVQTGDYVRVKIVSYPEVQSFFKGKLVENFGKISSSAKDDIKKMMAEYDIPFSFPEEVLKEVSQMPNEVTERDFSDRKNLQDKAFVTIDGETAQDFDDAIFVEKQYNFYRLYVAIADVSYYVQEDSALEQEAFYRGNSSYFPNFCSPMLPEKLSNHLCSLKPDLPRLVMIQEIDFDFKGEPIKERVYPSVIKSRKRLSYAQAQDIIDGFSDLKGEYLDSMKQAQSLAQILLKKQIRDQGFDLDIPETLVVVDEEGETQDILREKRLFSHKMIELFMLSANKAVSAFLEKAQTPLMYRIHESPEEEKLKALQRFSKILGFSKPFHSRTNLVRFLSQYKDHKQISLIHKLVLRSFSQARYSAFNKGHYGLNFSSYTHFTSPIRRYCDLFIHRLIKQVLSKHSKTFLSPKEIEKRAHLISQKEQNSVQAERQIIDIKKARFLSKYIGQSFSAYISSISSFGFFVTIKQFPAEGLVRFRDLQGFWEPDAFQLSVRNKRSSYRILFGDEVEILIMASNAITGNVDFQLLSHKNKKFNNIK